MLQVDVLDCAIVMFQKKEAWIKRPKINISRKRFNLIAINKPKCVKPTKRRQCKVLKLVTAKSLKMAANQIIVVRIFTILFVVLYIYIYIYICVCVCGVWCVCVWCVVCVCVWCVVCGVCVFVCV